AELPLRTPYYSATIPIWHDNISPSPLSIRQWETEWRSPEAGEVVRSIGAWIILIQKPLQRAENEGGDGSVNLARLPIVPTLMIITKKDNVRKTLATIHAILSHHRATSSNYTAATVDTEPILLVIGMPQPLRPLLAFSNDEWEDLCQDCGGWEWIDSEAMGKNEFGENVGLQRLKEALEANEWDGGKGDIDVNDSDFEAEMALGDGKVSNAGDIEVGFDAADMHEAILGPGEGLRDKRVADDLQVEELERLMLRMQAIKGPFPFLLSVNRIRYLHEKLAESDRPPAEKGAGMPEEERKRFAAKAVKDVMKSV
ncbi:MAG: hypothetical protein Q9179_007907, partial [Wetmoreana sp. 5 TL-2023]